MRILITGAKGQLGQALELALATHELSLVDLPEVDITSKSAIAAAVDDARAEIVIHCAAYTDVDGAARDPSLAYHVNGLGTQNVALACRESGASMVHLSTNEVFSGDNTAGYEEWMPLAPINPYGRSKAAAEVHVRELLERHFIVRTAWLFAPGGRNFVHAIKKRAIENGYLHVVADEVANPTYAPDLAAAIARLITTGQFGTFHLVNEGACSRWAFAREILRQSGLGDVPVTPILSKAYARASQPPAYSALLNRQAAGLGITLRGWQDALSEYLHPESRS